MFVFNQCDAGDRGGKMDEEFCKNVKEKEKETFEEKEIILIPRVRNSIRFFFASFEEKEKKNPGKGKEEGNLRDARREIVDIYATKVEIFCVFLKIFFSLFPD